MANYKLKGDSKLVLLDSHVATGTEATYTFTKTLDFADYSEIIIYMKIEPTLTFALELIVNGDTNTSYYTRGHRVLGSGATALIDIGASTEWNPATTSIITGVNASVMVEIHLRNVLNASGETIFGMCESYNGSSTVWEKTGLWLNQVHSTITSLTTTTSTSTWKAGSEIITYGLKK